MFEGDVWDPSKLFNCLIKQASSLKIGEHDELWRWEDRKSRGNLYNFWKTFPLKRQQVYNELKFKYHRFEVMEAVKLIISYTFIIEL